MLSRFFASLLVLGALFSATPAHALSVYQLQEQQGTPKTTANTSRNSGFARGAWVPYWRLDTGIAEARTSLSSMTSVSAFGYTVNSDGTVNDKIGINQDPWRSFSRDAKRAGVKVYATVSWFDGAAIDSTLSSSRSRSRHERNILSIVNENPELDGIEIDYEAKLASTKDTYSTFLADLAKSLHKNRRTLICDIEPRTPVADRYGAGAAIPSSAYQVANDYRAIGSACDEVRVMAYDQGLADITLLRSGSRPYAPISDTAWAAKTVAQATAEIPANKVVLGIPTYGRVYRIDAAGGYTPISSINYPDAVALAAAQKQTPTRNRSGELSFSYRGLTSGLPGSAAPTGVMNTYFVTFSDATSIASHVTLAHTLGIGGAALFKLDGYTDPKFWNGFLK